MVVRVLDPIVGGASATGLTQLQIWVVGSSRRRCATQHTSSARPVHRILGRCRTVHTVIALRRTDQTRRYYGILRNF